MHLLRERTRVSPPWAMLLLRGLGWVQPIVKLLAWPLLVLPLTGFVRGLVPCVMSCRPRAQLEPLCALLCARVHLSPWVVSATSMAG